MLASHAASSSARPSLCTHGSEPWPQDSNAQRVLLKQGIQHIIVDMLQCIGAPQATVLTTVPAVYRPFFILPEGMLGQLIRYIEAL